MADGFLGRWSKRKLDAREDALAGQQTDDVAAPIAAAMPAVPAPQPPLPAPVPTPPPLTLEDVKALTADSDFSRFVAPDVAPEVKTAAMKKLFTDPRYNVMDGLDVYVDDYTKADPIPESMLRKLASAQFLRLFEEKDGNEGTNTPAVPTPREVADDPAGESVAQSETASQAVPEPPLHADPDLRLQQDDAPAGEEPGRGAE
jgi:hypothetical protein